MRHACSLWLLLLALPSVARAQDEFTPGLYLALPRDSSTLNRFRGVEFELRHDGVLVWRRGGTVEQRMEWRAAEALFEVDDALGCGIAPTGGYRVRRWVEGFAFEPVRDGCTMRVAALNGIYLVPKDQVASGHD